MHLSLYPIGAGVFAGAALTLLAAVIISLLVDVGYIQNIQHDFSQWGNPAHLEAVKNRVLTDCLKENSLLVRVLAAGFQEAYTNLQPPIDKLSYVRPTITVLYLVIAALFFVAAVERRNALVFGLVLLAALLATGADVMAAAGILGWKMKTTGCQDKQLDAAVNRMGESELKRFAQDLEGAPGQPGL